MPFLLCLEGYHEDSEWPVGDVPVTIGRSRDMEVSLRDMKVSRRHARIFKNDVRFFIEDMGSTNGTYVDREKITKPTLLQNEQFFQVGDCLFIFTEISLREKARSSVYQIGEQMFEKGHQYKELLSNIVQDIVEKKKELAKPKKAVKPGTLRWLFQGLWKSDKENLPSEDKKTGT